MDAHDLGDLVAYTAIADGTPIYDRQGRRIGVVEHVMEVGGIFEGVIVHTHPLPGRHLYADADQIAEIHERGVVLSVTERELHVPQQESRRDGPGRSRSRRDCGGRGTGSPASGWTGRPARDQVSVD